MKITSGSWSIDVQELVIEVIHLLDRVGQRIGNGVNDFRVEIRHAAKQWALQSIRVGTRDEELYARVDLGRDLVDDFAEFWAVNEGCGRRGSDGMQEWLPHQVVVDQSWNETELCAAQPQADVFESVFHEERHAVAVLVSGAQEDVRYAVGVFLEIVEGPRLVFEDKARFVSMLLCSASKHFWHAKVLLLVEVDEGQKSKVAESTASIPGSCVPG